MLSDYEYFKVIGDCETFSVEYKPKGGKKQEMALDAENEADALFEAASIAECDSSELSIDYL